jgi:hypothetical protein
VQCSLKAAYDCIKAFSETDFTEDLKKFDVPHGMCSTQKDVINADLLAFVKAQRPVAQRSA